jgi:hypothetical protein
LIPDIATVASSHVNRDWQRYPIAAAALAAMHRIGHSSFEAALSASSPPIF